jgi:predicted alpha/beta superfamily hydrolase
VTDVEGPPRRLRARRPPRAGAMAVLRDVYSPELHNHRDVFVYLPPSYGAQPSGRRTADPDARFPVLYMHDGQNLFDPELSFSGAWRVDLAMQTAARLGYEAIVVGVANTGGSRIDEYSPFFDDRVGGGGTADRYVDFLLHTLKPMVDAQFRTRPEREGRASSARAWAGSSRCTPSSASRTPSASPAR